jgi:hypothetical protein
MSAEMSSGLAHVGNLGDDEAHAAAMKKFFVPGRSRASGSATPSGKTRMLYRAPRRRRRRAEPWNEPDH